MGAETGVQTVTAAETRLQHCCARCDNLRAVDDRLVMQGRERSEERGLHNLMVDVGSGLSIEYYG